MSEAKDLPIIKRILILGSGFGGITVLKKLQRKFRNDKHIKIVLVSRDNFILFTPMLPEVATGMIETRHIVTPVRSFLHSAKFYEAEIQSIDLNSKEVTISYSVGNRFRPFSSSVRVLTYDYLVIALGSETSFFGITGARDNCFTMKDIDDAIILRNHILNCLEQASLEMSNVELSKKLLTFVVVGGGFNGIETVGVLNDFVRDTIKKYYPDINMAHVKIILVSADDKILAQIDEELGSKARQKLDQRGVEFVMSTHVTGVTTDSVILDSGNKIDSFTTVWSAGVAQSKLIADLRCEHDKHKRIVTNSNLEILGFEGEVYAIGDCASIINPITGEPYPPTAQHAIKQGEVASRNIISQIERKAHDKKPIKYKTRGMMAEIGKHYGVATLFGIKIHGFLAWWLWRTFYLANLPTVKKKLKIMGDWTSDLFFSPDVAMIKRFVSREPEKLRTTQNDSFTKPVNLERK